MRLLLQHWLQEKSREWRLLEARQCCDGGEMMVVEMEMLVVVVVVVVLCKRDVVYAMDRPLACTMAAA